MGHFLRQIGYVLIAALAGVYVYSALRGPQGLPALEQKWDKVRQVELENQLLRRQIEEKRARIRDLKFNPEVQGTEIRKRSGKQQRGDRTYILPGDGSDRKEAPADSDAPNPDQDP